MSMHARTIVLVLVAGVACGGAEHSRATPAPTATRVSETKAPATPAAPKGAASGTDDDGFVAPGADGWGTAASLRYLEEVRGSANANEALPMIVVLHGLGDRPHPEWIGGLPVPVRLVLPQAPTSYAGGFAWFAYTSAEARPEDLARDIAGATEQLARAIDVLRARRPTRGLALVAGFSQGGMLSYALALRHPEQVALAVPIAGFLPEPLWPKQHGRDIRYPPIHALHGDADGRVPIALARSLTAHLARLGFDARLDEQHGVAHAITPMMFEHLRTTLASALTDGGTH